MIQRVCKALAFSPDGRTLASAGSSNKEVSLWQVPTGRRLAVLAHYETSVVSMVFSPDGTRLALGDREGGLRILTVHEGRPLVDQRAHNGAVWGLVSPTYAGPGHLRKITFALFWDLRRAAALTG